MSQASLRLATAGAPTRLSARGRTLVYALAGALLLVVASRGDSAAHALLLRATPSSAQTLAQAPSDVQLLFSEPVDPVFSNVHVLDASGRTVDRGDSHVDPADEHVLAASLQPNLPNGVYTVVWRSLSTIDVHPDEGRYSLFVGVPVHSEAGMQAPAGVTATPETTFARWWFLVAASIFGGGLATWKLVVGPVLGTAAAGVRQSAARRTRRLVLVGGTLLVLGTLFAALAQAAAAANVPLVAGAGQPLLDLLGRGRFAAIWWPRVGIELAALLLVLLGGLDGIAAESALAMVPAVLLTSSLTSHGAALNTGAGIGILVDWLHALGATVWIGGLASLTLLVPLLAGRQPAAAVLGATGLPGQQHARGIEQTGATAVSTLPDTVAPELVVPLVPRVVARFSRLALLALVVLALSGAVQAGLQVGSWNALLATTYGQLVLLKVGLLLVMLGLAALNTRRGRRPTHDGRRWLLRGTRVELAMGVVVLAVAAILAGTPPTRDVPPPAAAQVAHTR